MPDGNATGSNSSDTSSEGRTDVLAAIRKQLGLAMVNATSWADQNRRQVAAGSLLGVACGAALLVRIHGIPGVTRITSNAQLAAKLLQQQQNNSSATLRLPVLLTGVSVQGGLLLVEAVHYPTLLRWFDAYKGRPASRLLPPNASSDATAGSSSSSSSIGQQAAADTPRSISISSSRIAALSASRPGSLTCCIAGLQDVQPRAQQLLQQHLACTPYSVHSLRVFAVTQQADSTAAAAATASSQDEHESGSSSSSSSSSTPEGKKEQLRSLTFAQESAAYTADLMSAASPANARRSTSCWGATDNPLTWGPECALWAELWLLGGLPSSKLKAAAKAVSSSSSGSSTEQPQPASDANRPSSVSSSTEPPQPVSYAWPGWLLLRRRRDAAVLLLGCGLARLFPQEDVEWLGVRPAAARTYAQAFDRARVKQLGLHQQQQQQAAGGAGVLLGSIRRWWQQRRRSAQQH